MYIKKRKTRLTAVTLMSCRIVQNLLDFLWGHCGGATIQHITFNFEEYGIGGSAAKMDIACELMTTEGFKLKIYHFHFEKDKGVWNFYGEVSPICIEIVHGHTNSLIEVEYQIKDTKHTLKISKGYDVSLSLHNWIESRRRELLNLEN